MTSFWIVSMSTGSTRHERSQAPAHGLLLGRIRLPRHGGREERLDASSGRNPELRRPRGTRRLSRLGKRVRCRDPSVGAYRCRLCVHFDVVFPSPFSRSCTVTRVTRCCTPGGRSSPSFCPSSSILNVDSAVAMPDSLTSSAGRRPLRHRLLPSWVVSYFARVRASPSAPMASSAVASSPSASGDDADVPQRHPQPSSSAAVAASPSTLSSSSPGKRPGLRDRLSISKLYRRLSRALTPSSRRSTRSPVPSDSPHIVSDALQMPPSSATDTGTGPSILRLSSIDVTP